MKRAEVDLGELSPEEQEFLPTDPKRVEMVETFLYTSLSIAKDARLRMERRSPTDERYLLDKIEYDGAIANAKLNLEKLRAVAHTLDPVLARMVEWEGI